MGEVSSSSRSGRTQTRLNITRQYFDFLFDRCCHLKSPPRNTQCRESVRSQSFRRLIGKASCYCRSAHKALVSQLHRHMNASPMIHETRSIFGCIYTLLRVKNIGNGALNVMRNGIALGIVMKTKTHESSRMPTERGRRRKHECRVDSST